MDFKVAGTTERHHLDPDGHQDRGPRPEDHGRGARAGAQGPPAHPRRDGQGARRAAAELSPVRAAHHHDADQAGEDRRDHRSQGQDDPRDPGRDRRQDQHRGLRAGHDRRRRRRGGREGPRDGRRRSCTEPEVGRIYEGPVKSTTAFGAFVEIMPGIEGLLHITELQHGRTEKTEDVVKKGDIVQGQAARGGRARPHAAVPEGAASRRSEAGRPWRRSASTTGLFRTVAPERPRRPHRTLPGVRSAAVGVWVRRASAHEAREQMGVSHLLEHMVFKGTERRTAKEIALALEVAGRRARRLHQPRPHQLPGPRPRRRTSPRRGRPHRSGPPAAAARGATSSSSATSSSRRSTTVEDTPGRSGLRAASRARCGPSTPTATRSSARRRPSARSRRDDLRRLHRPGYYPRQLRGRGGRERGPRAAARGAGAGGLVRGGRRASRRAPPVAPPAGRAGRRAPGGAGHGPDAHRLRHRHLAATGTARRFALAMLAKSSAAGCRAGCSSGSGKSWGWRTRSTPTSSSTSRRAWRASTSARSPPRRTRRRRRSARSTRRLAAKGCRRRSWPTGKQQLKGQVMLSLESPAAGWTGWPGRRCTTSRTARWTRCWRRSTR